jgi:hypothetical protein
VVSFTPRRFAPGEGAPGSHWIGVWVDPRADLDGVEKKKFLTLTGLELRPVGRRPARNQSLYRPRYPGSYNNTVHYYSAFSCKVKAKLSLYRPWRPLELRVVEAPTFSHIRLTDGGKAVSPTRRPPFTPRKILGTHFCSRLSRPQGHSAAGEIR